MSVCLTFSGVNFIIYSVAFLYAAMTHEKKASNLKNCIILIANIIHIDKQILLTGIHVMQILSNIPAKTIVFYASYVEQNKLTISH